MRCKPENKCYRVLNEGEVKIFCTGSTNFENCIEYEIKDGQKNFKVNAFNEETAEEKAKIRYEDYKGGGEITNPLEKNKEILNFPINLDYLNAFNLECLLKPKKLDLGILGYMYPFFSENLGRKIICAYKSIGKEHGYLAYATTLYATGLLEIICDVKKFKKKFNKKDKYGYKHYNITFPDFLIDTNYITTNTVQRLRGGIVGVDKQHFKEEEIHSMLLELLTEEYRKNEDEEIRGFTYINLKPYL